MNVHLVDGTYELFRSFFGAPPKRSPDGREVGATLGLMRSLLSLLGRPGTTHIACAFDHVIESFRNELFSGYKTGEGVDPELMAQFPLAEEAVHALGIVVWPMVEFEADDALAAAADRFQGDSAVDQILICSPDKDLTQLVSAAELYAWTDAATSHSTSRASWTNSVCTRSRSPIGSRWWAIPPTAIRESRAGERNPPPPSSSATGIWNRYRKTLANGDWLRAVPCAWRKACPPTERRSCSTDSWRRCAGTSLSRRAWGIWSGWGPAPVCRRCVMNWATMSCLGAFPAGEPPDLGVPALFDLIMAPRFRANPHV
jgi:hypothetical protein